MAFGEARTHSAASTTFSASFTRISPDISLGAGGRGWLASVSCLAQFAAIVGQKAAVNDRVECSYATSVVWLHDTNSASDSATRSTAVVT